MNIKMLLLFLISTLLVYFIYYNNYSKDYYLTIINTNDNNLNKYITNYANNYKINSDYSNKSLEIENIITLLYNNQNGIKNTIYKSDFIIISVGNNDYINEDINTINKELSTLFSLIRKINNKLIIFICPRNINKITIIKEICKKYNIIFINSNSFENDDLLSKYVINYLNTKNS